MPDPVQPPEGQGSEGIFDQYLTEVPEDAREVVSGYLKDAERHVNTRLQDASALEKQFGAYREVDLSGYTPEQLGQVLSWYGEVSSDPDTFKQWLTETAREQGVLPAGGVPEGTDDDGFIPQTQAELDAYVQKAVQTAISPVVEKQNTIEQETQLQNLERQIASDFEKVEKDNSVTLTDEEKEVIVSLGEGHDGRDWIPAGFKKLQEIRGNAATEFVKERTQQPAKAVPSSGGQAATKPVTDWAELTKMAAERLRQGA